MNRTQMNLLALFLVNYALALLSHDDHGQRNLPWSVMAGVTTFFFLRMMLLATMEAE